MKKKSVHKVSSAKKVISKIPLKKKKSFSLRSWLLGGLVLLVASAYGLYQYNLQPKGIKVLQIPGTVLDYLEPEAVSINAVKTCGQDPECADMVDAARRAGATTSLQQQSQTSIRVAKEIEKSLESKPIKESKNEEVIEARQEAVKTAESIVTKVETQINTHLNAAKIANQPVVGSGVGCSTQHFTVAEGETMVGLVANSKTDPNAGENTGSNMIVKCSGGSWVPTGCYEKDGVVTGPNSCKLTIKPIYAGGKNCYNNGGSSVLGDGSITEKGDGTASRCDGGKMTEGLIKIDGLWMTESEKLKYEFDREVKKKADQAAANKAREWECVNAGDDGKIGKWNGNGCVVDSRADTCAAKGSGYEWNSSSEKCVAKNTPNNTSSVYNDQDDCLDSIVDRKKETCRQSPNGSTYIRIPLTSGTSTTSQYVGGVYKSLDECDNNLPSGQTCRQAPNGTSWTRFTTSTTNNSPNTPIYEGGSYGSETECENANPGKSCRQSPNGSTWAVFSLTQTNFGNNNNQPTNFTPSPDVSKQGYLTPEKCKQEYGVDCLQIGAGAWYPPTTPLVSNNSTIVDTSRPTSQYPNAGKECGSQPSTKRDESGEWINPSCGQACGGLGSYLDSDGKRKCNYPGQANAEGPTRFDNPEVGKNTGIGAGAGCAAGATVGAIYGAGLGFGVFSAPVAIAGGVIGCVAGAVTGGTIGLAVTEPVSPAPIINEENNNISTFWAGAKPVLDKEDAYVSDASQCSSGKSNKFIVDNETKYYCMDDSAKYVDPTTGLRITGSSCSTDTDCNSGKCIKRYRFYSDGLAADLCE